MAFQQFVQPVRFKVDPAGFGKGELRLQAALAPEGRPVVAPAVVLGSGADVVVALPAEARSGPAMRLGQAVAEGCKVHRPTEVEMLEKQKALVAANTMGQCLGCGQPGGAQGAEAVRLRREGIGVARFVHLQEPRGAVDAHRIAAVDAAAADAPRRVDAQLALEDRVQAEVRRVFARLSRSMRMLMKARSKRLRQSAEARSRSSTRMRRMRASLAAVTLAPRAWLETDR